MKRTLGLGAGLALCLAAVHLHLVLTPLTIFLCYIITVIWLAPLWLSLGATLLYITYVDLSVLHARPIHSPDLLALAVEDIVLLLVLGSLCIAVYLAQHYLARTRLLLVELARQRSTAQQAQQQAEDALAAQDELILAVSHRLRTPITILIGNVSLALRQIDQGPDAMHDHLARISRAGWDINQMVDLIMQESAQRHPEFTTQAERLSGLASVMTSKRTSEGRIEVPLRYSGLGQHGGNGG